MAVPPPHGQPTTGATRRVHANGRQEGRRGDRPHRPDIGQAEQRTRARNAEGQEPLGMALTAPSKGTSRSAPATEQGGEKTRTPREHECPSTQRARGVHQKAQRDQPCGRQRPHGMAYQHARTRDTRTGQPATRTARDARQGQQVGGRREVASAPPRRPPGSAAQTAARHCTRQGRSGAKRHALAL